FRSDPASDPMVPIGGEQPCGYLELDTNHVDDSESPAATPRMSFASVYSRIQPLDPEDSEELLTPTPSPRSSFGSATGMVEALADYLPLDASELGRQRRAHSTAFRRGDLIEVLSETDSLWS
ncbi:hypothetical protein HDU91_002017, partial [Kappamyces sp. JEL0680]